MPLPSRRTDVQLRDFWVRTRFNDAQFWREEYIRSFANQDYLEESLPPIGSIIPVVDRYWGSSSRTSPTTSITRGATNPISSRWHLCDGSAPLDTASPVWNVGGRHVPNLNSDGVFLAGNTPGNTSTTGNASARGGSHTQTLTNLLANHTHTINQHTHTLDAHTHNIGQHSHNVNSHSHSVPEHTHEYLYRYGLPSANYGSYGVPLLLQNSNDLGRQDNDRLSISLPLQGVVGRSNTAPSSTALVTAAPNFDIAGFFVSGNRGITNFGVNYPTFFATDRYYPTGANVRYSLAPDVDTAGFHAGYSLSTSEGWPSRAPGRTTPAGLGLGTPATNAILTSFPASVSNTGGLTIQPFPILVPPIYRAPATTTGSAAPATNAVDLTTDPSTSVIRATGLTTNATGTTSTSIDFRPTYIGVPYYIRIR